MRIPLVSNLDSGAASQIRGWQTTITLYNSVSKQSRLESIRGKHSSQHRQNNTLIYNFSTFISPLFFFRFFLPFSFSFSSSFSPLTLITILTEKSCLNRRANKFPLSIFTGLLNVYNFFLAI